MQINIISIFPQMFESWSRYGLIGQAIQKSLIRLDFVNPRDFTSDKHKSVDDRPFGGGDGMVMLYEPLAKAIVALKEKQLLGRLIYMSPQGRQLTSTWAKDCVSEGGPITLLAGRYGGIDQRIIEDFVDEELSVGDYILSGGELPAMTVVDVLGRYLPGVLGNEISSLEESFENGLLEAPLFTRPAELEHAVVPEVLRQGHHEKINELRRSLSLVLSFIKRPDLVTERLLEVRKSAENLQTLTSAELAACGLNHHLLRQIQSEVTNV